MAGIQVIVKDKEGNLKQYYELSRDNSGKAIKINKINGVDAK